MHKPVEGKSTGHAPARRETSVWPGVNTKIHWSFEDPARFEGSELEKLARFREVRDLIEQRVNAWVAEQQTMVR